MSPMTRIRQGAALPVAAALCALLAPASTEGWQAPPTSAATWQTPPDSATARQAPPDSAAARQAVGDSAAAHAIPPASVRLQVPSDPALVRLLTRPAAPQEAPERSTRRGLIIGAVAGAAVGLGIGSFIALYCVSENDSCPGAIPVVGLLGAASGALAGAVLGAAIPARAPREPATPDRPAGSWGETDTGSFAVAAGAAHARIEDDSSLLHEGSGWSVRAVFLAELKPWLALGPELGYASFGAGGEVRQGAAAVQLRWPGARIRPYVGAQLGAYQMTLPSLEFLGGGISAGARVRPFARRRHFVEVEARLSSQVQNIAPMAVRALSLGVGTAW
ncbi:MAG: hypothetical protein WEA24_03080 [Gemmatimonadota bacterium]